jgi:precorrin-6A/cobalt-precorrin-6A reductase
MAPNTLILGGTSEATALASTLSHDPRFDPLTSFAGRTSAIVPPSIPHRVGGFGGIEGLAAFLTANKVAALVDATHPFSPQISAHAVAAARRAGVPLLRLERPPWVRREGDQWTEVDDMRGAAAALGLVPQRVFLTIGKSEVDMFRIADQHTYLVRAIEGFDPGLRSARVIAARGPFDVEDERALLRREKIDIVVTKNSGGSATVAKLEAARQRELQVVVVKRPTLEPAQTVATVDEALTWLGRHATLSTERGE